MTSAADDRLVWIDLEMTGLDPTACHILEIATVVTDPRLDVVAEGPVLVIHQDEEAMKTLSDWSREHFTVSGLIDRSLASDVSLAEAEAATLSFVQEHCTKDTAPLCGNSVHTDRTFLWHYMRSLHDFLHYRNVDVSTLKELFRRWYPDRYQPPKKAGSHEAKTDIHESIAELRYYRDTFLT
jgi:oligoribonuclease